VGEPSLDIQKPLDEVDLFLDAGLAGDGDALYGPPFPALPRISRDLC